MPGDSVGIDLKPDKLLSKLGFDYPRQQQYVSSLSGGERRRLHLAAVLQRKPNFLILDEPTNDLDLQTIEVCAPKVGIFVSSFLRRPGLCFHVSFVLSHYHSHVMLVSKCQSISLAFLWCTGRNVGSKLALSS